MSFLLSKYYRIGFYEQSHFLWPHDGAESNLVGQIATPKRPSRSWHILCGMIWDLILKGHSLAQKHLSKQSAARGIRINSDFHEGHLHLDVPVKMDTFQSQNPTCHFLFPLFLSSISNLSANTVVLLQLSSMSSIFTATTLAQATITIASMRNQQPFNQSSCSHFCLWLTC